MIFRSIRQAADVATLVVDRFGSAVEPDIHEVIQSHFMADAAQNGESGTEFMQGFFSGVNFCHSYLEIRNGEFDPATEFVARLMVESARKYLESIDRQI